MKQEADWSRSMRRSQKPRSGSLSDSPELRPLLEELGFGFFLFKNLNCRGTAMLLIQACFLLTHP